jgi:hypothetical protein
VLLRLWDVLTAESLSFPDYTREAQRLLHTITLDQCFEPERWPEFVFFARIVPDKTLLPVRTMYNGVTRNIGNNFLSANPDNPQSIWVAGPDLIADVIRTGRGSEVLEAIRIAPHGKQADMRAVNLRGMVEIDPYKHDLFKRVIELRKSRDTNQELGYWLKIFANAMYGFFAEVNPYNVHPLPVKVFKGKNSHYIYEPEQNPRDTVVTIERPGPWYAPYLASLITSGGRLLLAMLEQCVEERGGTYLYADTDALGICASDHGGSLDHIPGCEGKRLLSWTEVEEIRECFNLLNPYDRTYVPEFLNLTHDNWVYPKTQTCRRHLLGLSIRTKAYCLYERNGDEIRIINPKIHGLGHLYPPVKSPKGWEDEHDAPLWTYQAWEWMVRHILGLKQISLPWLSYPLMQREAVTTCNLLRGLHQWESFRPFNFFMRPVLRIHNAAYGDDTLSLVSPLEDDASKWANAECFNTSDPSDTHTYKITTNMLDTIEHPERIFVKDFETLLRGYLTRIEYKSLGAGGAPCRSDTRGLLQRMHIVAGKIKRIGKECPFGIEDTDQPTEIMEFATTEYNEPDKKKDRLAALKKNGDMVQPTIKHFNDLRKIGYRNLIHAGCSRRFLNKIKHREFVRAIALREYERAVRECKSSK